MHAVPSSFIIIMYLFFSINTFFCLERLIDFQHSTINQSQIQKLSQNIHKKERECERDT